MQTPSNSIKLLRASALVCVAAVPVLVPELWRVAADAGRAAGRGVSLRPHEVLTALTAGAALLVLAWLAVVVGLELLALVPGAVGRSARRASGVLTPALLRRLVGGVLGVGVAAGLAPGAAVAAPSPSAVRASAALFPGPSAHRPPSVPAHAPWPDPGFAPPAPGGRVTPPRQWSAPERGWVPEPPAVRAQPDVRVLAPSPRARPELEPAHEVVVHRGDTLWSVAARHLGPAATDAEIAAAWPQWFAANRSVIGHDPHLLHPGQRLRPPEEWS